MSYARLSPRDAFGDEPAPSTEPPQTSFDPTRFWLEGGIWSTLDEATGKKYEGVYAVETATPRPSSTRLDTWIEAQCKLGLHVAMSAPMQDPFLGSVVRLDAIATTEPVPSGIIAGHDRPALEPVECEEPKRSLLSSLSTNTLLGLSALGLAGAFTFAIARRRRRRGVRS